MPKSVILVEPGPAKIAAGGYYRSANCYFRFALIAILIDSFETEIAKAMDEKERAAASAAELVKNGMVIGLGSGSTAELAIRILCEKVKNGLQVIGVPTSHKSEVLAHTLGMRLATLEDYPALDLTIDGADEVEL